MKNCDQEPISDEQQYKARKKNPLSIIGHPFLYNQC